MWLIDEILNDINQAKQKITSVELEIGHASGPSKQVDTLIQAENLLTYCHSRLSDIDPESKPLEAFLHPIDAYKGLKAKYLVFKADTGERVDNCFILRPDKDPAAVAALRAYAAATDNKILAEDIYNWVGKGENVYCLQLRR